MDDRAATAMGNGDDVKAQVRSLRYELDALKQDREMTRLRHEKEVRELGVRYEGEMRNAKVWDCDHFGWKTFANQ